jgi:hypothetical protein
MVNNFKFEKESGTFNHDIREGGFSSTRRCYMQLPAADFCTPDNYPAHQLPVG